MAGYRVEEVLNGQEVTVTGRTEDVTGSVTLDDSTLTAATIEVDLTTVATDESSRDDYVRTQATAPRTRAGCSPPRRSTSLTSAASSSPSARTS